MADFTLTLDPATGSPFIPIPRAEPRPVQAWEQDPSTGKRTPSNRQEVDAQGVPLFELACLALTTRYGRVEPQVIALRLASHTQPTAEEFGVSA